MATRIITSLDDVIVPVSDIYGLEPGPKLKVDLHQYGGHVGYMDGFPLQHKVGDLVLQPAVGMANGPHSQLALFVVAHDRDVDVGEPEVLGQFDVGDGEKAEARVVQVR